MHASVHDWNNEPTHIRSSQRHNLLWGLVLAVWLGLLSLLGSSAQAQPIKLNDPLVTDGAIDDVWISPNNQWVVYVADQDTDQIRELYSVPAGGGTVTKLNAPLASSPGTGVFFFVISPDSQRVVYLGDQDTDKVKELYSVPIGGGTPTKLNAPLVAGGEVNGFLISADGTRVLYIADQETDEILELYSVPTEGGTVTKLNQPFMPGGGQFSLIVNVSPDGMWVVYVADPEIDGTFDLYSVPFGGGTVTKLNSPPVAGGDVDFLVISPDSARVVYVADQDTDEMFELYSVPIGGGTVTKLNGPLVAEGDVDDEPLIDPDSQRVVYRADQETDNEFELYSVPIGGGSVTKLNGPLVADGDVLDDFRISPDSIRVIYRADQETDQERELYSVPIGGGSVTKLNAPLPTDGDVFRFRGSPDSSRIIYTSDQDTEGTTELYSVPLGGGAITKLNGPLVDGGDVSSIILISADSTRIVYEADQDTDGVQELYSVILQAELKALFESPLADAIVAGIALIRGWAFDIVVGETIASVKLFIDGAEDAIVVCCSERADVRDAFPEYAASNTLNSGWGLTKNWANEDAGAHTIRIEIVSSTGEAFSETRTVTVVKPGDFEFLDQFLLSNATASRVGQQMQLSGVQIRDKDSQATATVDGAYRWRGPSQQFELESSTVVAQAQPQRMFALQHMQIVKDWWQQLWSLFAPPSVVAQGVGLRTAWEGPVIGPVGGVDLVRGWGYEQAPAEALETIRFFIDNSQNALVVCCSPRADVAAAFPGDVNALLSGWGLTLNWGNLTEGQHMAQVQYVSTTGESVLSDTRTITVIRPGGFGFLSNLDLTSATVSLDGEEIVITGATVTESGTGNTATVTLRLAWDIGAQGLRLVSAVTT